MLKTIRFISQIMALALFFGVANAKEIIIYHTSDVHGAYGSEPDSKNPALETGGFPILKAIANTEDSPVLFFDSGDWYQGTPEGNLSKGMASVELMNAMPYSVSGLGNHEYDFGPQNMAKIIKKAKFPVVSANIFYTKTGKRPSYVKPYTIVKVDGTKIGVIGFTAVDTKTSTMPIYVEDLTFTQPYEEVKKVIEEVKKKKPDVIVAIVHDGLYADGSGRLFDGNVDLSEDSKKHHNLAIARAVPGEIAVIFGGHNHNGFLNGYLDKESGTLFVESLSKLKHSSRVVLNFDDETKKLVSKSSKLISLRKDTAGEDEKIAKMVQKYKDLSAKEMDKFVAKNDKDLTRHDCAYDSTLGSLVTDIMRNSTKTDIAVTNTHGIRTGIPKGDITKRHIFQSFPFDNTITTLDMTGADITELVSGNLRADENGMQYSGLTAEFSFDKNKKPVNLKIKINGKPIDLKKTYTVTTNNYLAIGGSGGKAFTKGTNFNFTDVNIRDAVEPALKEMGTVPAQKCGDRFKAVKK